MAHPRPLQGPRVLLLHHARVLGGAETSLRTHLEHARDCNYFWRFRSGTSRRRELELLEFESERVTDATSVPIPTTYRRVGLGLAPAQLWEFGTAHARRRPPLRCPVDRRLRISSMPVASLAAGLCRLHACGTCENNPHNRYPVAHFAARSQRSSYHRRAPRNASQGVFRTPTAKRSS